MNNLLEKIRGAHLLSVTTEEILRKALRMEGRENLLDIFLSNDRRTGRNRREVVPGSGEVFHKAYRFFNRETTKDEKCFLGGSEKIGEAYVRYWEEAEGRDESVTMVIEYSEGAGQEREWFFRLCNRTGTGLFRGEGKLILRSLLNGRMQDGISGVAAEHEYSLHEGIEVCTLIKTEHRIHGVLWSPDDHTPAIVDFDEGGAVKAERFFRNGKYMTRSGGRPNYIQYWEGGRGRRIEQWRRSKASSGQGDWRIEDWSELHRDPDEGPADIRYTVGGVVAGVSYHWRGENLSDGWPVARARATVKALNEARGKKNGPDGIYYEAEGEEAIASHMDDGGGCTGGKTLKAVRKDGILTLKKGTPAAETGDVNGLSLTQRSGVGKRREGRDGAKSKRGGIS